MSMFINGMNNFFSDKIEKYTVVSSTNDILKEKAKNGAPVGTVVLAEMQTAGRGRRNRPFYSPDGGGIYMSVLICPKSDTVSVTAYAAAAVARVLEKHSGKPTFIKWVNDIFQSGKKVCGILAEGQRNEKGDISYIVLGIGINLKEPSGGFPEALRDIAGAVFDKNEAFDRNAIINDILNEIFFSRTDCFEEYKNRSMLIGEAVTVIQNGKPPYSAKVLGIERDFSLKVLLNNGETELLKSGEVSLKAVNHILHKNT